MLGLALRTYVRHVVPLTLASAVVLAPVWWFALALPAPADGDAAKQLYRLGWVIGASAWIPQLVVVGAAAPLVRAVAAGRPTPQLRAVAVAFAGLARAIVPCGVAVAAIAIGSTVLLVPGLVLAVMLALTGASEARGMPDPLLDSIAVARVRPWPLVIGMVAIVAVDAALAGGAYLAVFEPIAAKQPSPSSLDAARRSVQLIALGLVVLSPIAGCMLAAIRSRAPAR